ncbi:sulfotransferase domain-containing protein [Nocardioides sp. DS6]|uniref:Sulfotransferase domain-containing protein n=1 Tax=Nocardioides eburneus TaxID=3231482 RepID=A0ABV3STL0_9ACTN
MQSIAAPSEEDRVLTHAFLIGGMKCGTWTMFKLLRKHPAIAASKPKELKYFTNSAFGEWDDYHANFDIKPRTKVLLEGTVQYSRHPDTKDSAYKISRFDPSARFIYLMRDPVARIESQLAHRIAREEIDLTDQARRRELQKAISFSQYFTQAGAFASIFGPEQMYLQTFEHFVRNQVSVVEEIFGFLGVKVPDGVEALPPQNVRRADHGADRFALTAEEEDMIRDSLHDEAQSLTTAFGIDTSVWKRFWVDGQ